MYFGDAGEFHWQSPCVEEVEPVDVVDDVGYAVAEMHLS